jgi:N-acetylneuraminic acid mutarotase
LTDNIAHTYRVRAKSIIGISAWSNRIFALIQGDLWQFKANMPSSNRCFGAAELNGFIYAAGGYDTNSNVLNTLAKYDPVTDTWTTKTSMPTARTYLGMVSINGKIYAIGGLNNSPLNTLEEYDPVTDTWITKASMPTARYGLGVATVNGKIYAIGGLNNSPLNTVEEYDPVADTWTTKASMPIARYSLGVATVNGKIYAIGGYNNSPLNTVEEYNPIADTWTTKASIPTARYDLGVATVNGKIYAIGGWNNIPLNTVEDYNPVADTWTNQTEGPIDCFMFGTVAQGGNIYLIGGYYQCYDFSLIVVNTVLKFSLVSTVSTNSYTINCAKDNNFNLVLTGSNIYDSSTLLVTVQYDQTQLQLEDLSSFTVMPETAAGEIAGTDIKVLSVEPGKISFSMTKAVDTGKTWSGVINSIKFSSVNGQPTTITCMVNKL